MIQYNFYIKEKYHFDLLEFCKNLKSLGFKFDVINHLSNEHFIGVQLNNSDYLKLSIYLTSLGIKENQTFHRAYRKERIVKVNIFKRILKKLFRQ